MRRRRQEMGGMDMLLDTMCNTFGGVCFIALMVAIISAATPKAADDSDGEQLTERQVVDKEIARLKQRRDMLKSAIEVQSEFVKNATTGVVMKAELAKMAGDVVGNEEKIRLYEKKRVEYLDELAKMKTSVAYSRREASRLSRLLNELKEKAGKPLFDRHRVVRTPNEREIPGLRSIDVWLHGRRFYMMDDRTCVSEKETTDYSGRKKWERRIVSGKGAVMDENFFRSSKAWASLRRQTGDRSYVRIFVDTVSFDELCLLRDALISAGSMYNWHVCEEDFLIFHEGTDGRVQ